jgi:PilZ domain
LKETDDEQLERRKHAASVRRERRESNRRAFPRWPLEFEVRFGTGKEMKPAEGYEIGEGGLSFRTPNPIPLETELNLEYRLTSDHPWVRLKGVVKHCKHERIGTEFLNLRMRDRLEIVRLIAERK